MLRRRHVWGVSLTNVSRPMTVTTRPSCRKSVIACRRVSADHRVATVAVLTFNTATDADIPRLQTWWLYFPHGFKGCSLNLPRATGPSRGAGRPSPPPNAWRNVHNRSKFLSDPAWQSIHHRKLNSKFLIGA